MAADLEPRSLSLLRAPNFASVATLREDGSVLSVLTWIDVRDDGRIILNSAEGRAWPANVRRDPRITIMVPNHDDPYEYVSIGGRIVAEDHEHAGDDIDALAKKYLGKEKYPFAKPGELRVTFTVEPETVTHHGG